MLNNIMLQFSDKILKDTITFSIFEKKYKESPIFIYTTVFVNVDGYSKNDILKIELLDFKILHEQLRKLNANEIKQVIFYNIDETFELKINRIENEIIVSGKLKNFQHTVTFNFEFDSDLSIINKNVEQLNIILKEFNE